LPTRVWLLAGVAVLGLFTAGFAYSLIALHDRVVRARSLSPR